MTLESSGGVIENQTQIPKFSCVRLQRRGLSESSCCRIVVINVVVMVDQQKEDPSPLCTNAQLAYPLPGHLANIVVPMQDPIVVTAAPCGKYWN